MGLNLVCPQCGERMTMNFATVTVSCPKCGYQRGTGLDERAAEIKTKGRRPTVTVADPDKVNPRALALFNTGHDRLFLDDKAGALDSFQAALELQPDFIEAHLWIAKTAEDEQMRRDHLSSVLAYNPGHIEAMRLMMVLNGRLTPEEAERAESGAGPVVRRAEGPVSTRTSVRQCPVCKGDLTVDENSGRVTCRFCGYAADQAASAEGDGDLLTAAILERRAQPVKWVVGERLLHCTACGAQRTLTANQLSMRCPFCGSNHVIEQDALDSFEQPDGLVPFTVTREQAGAAIKERLRGFSERLKGLFDNNRIRRATLNGFYLPFWVFDASLEVVQTQIRKKPPETGRRYSSYQIQDAYTQTRSSDALFDVAVGAVESPPAELTAQLGDFDIERMVAYDPDLLAEYPAELYSLDFDTAALRARSQVAARMSERYGKQETDELIVNVYTHVTQMSFRLVLLPVWIATLVEEDHDERQALVNGQTGRVVLGKARRVSR